MGRLRQLHELRTPAAPAHRPAGPVELPAGIAGRQRPAGDRGRSDRQELRRAAPSSRPFSTRILRGDRVGIIGPNGAGKTTLLKLLTGELAPDTGTVRLGTGLEIARFDQHRDQLDPERTPWEILCPHGGDRVAGPGPVAPRRGLSARLPVPRRAGAAAGPALSGGERNRLLLAKILAQPCNLLILDEPTNDLDIETLDLLEEMLADHAGTLLLVSHDRDFRRPAGDLDHRLRGGGRAREYAGGYSDWLRQRPSRRLADRQPACDRAARRHRRARTTRVSEPSCSASSTDCRTGWPRSRAQIAEVETALADPGLLRPRSDAFAGASERAGATCAHSSRRWRSAGSSWRRKREARTLLMPGGEPATGTQMLAAYALREGFACGDLSAQLL